MCRWCLLPILLFTGGGLHAQRGGLELLVLDSVERAPVPGVIDWLKGNEPRVRTFLEWASNYTWPKP